MLALMGAGCLVDAGGSKTTGGGWFVGLDRGEGTTTIGNYVTFGFNAKPVGVKYYDDVWEADLINVKGKFQMVDHTSGDIVHGTFSTAKADFENTDNTLFGGTCTVNGIGPYLFVIAVQANDISIGIDMSGDGVIEGAEDLFYGGTLGGGSIRIHTR